MDKVFYERFSKLRSDHMHDRDSHNNYGCFNVEACRNCNWVYNSRAALSCSNCDSVIECVQCVECRDCAYCVGISGARFHILNEEYNEEGYYAKLKALGVDWNVDVG